MKSPRTLLAIATAVVFSSSYYAYAALGGASGVRIPFNGMLEQSGVAVSGEVVLTFGVWNVESAGSVCFTSSPITTTATSGRFAVVIGPITEACVKNRDVWIDVTVDLGAGPVTLPGRQRIYPSVASLSSGASDFDVGGNLSVTGSTQLSSLTVTGATQVGALTATGATQVADLTVGGNLVVGYYQKACYYNDPGGADTCSCTGANDRIVSGGVDCDYSGGPSRAAAYSHPMNDTTWYGLCDDTDVAGKQFVDPLTTYIICARIR